MSKSLKAETTQSKSISTGKKTTKDARFDLLPLDAIWQVARILGFGASKYEDRNWEGGLVWSSSYAAMQRHLALFWSGQDLDEQSGLSHLAHASWHCLILLAHYLRGIGVDDRGKGEALSAMETSEVDVQHKT